MALIFSPSVTSGTTPQHFTSLLILESVFVFSPTAHDHLSRDGLGFFAFRGPLDGSFGKVLTQIRSCFVSFLEVNLNG